ncbi:hypothetical protein LCM16_15675 [Mameliella alba]|nr:hypothetical protein [Mameliella alba]
MTLRDLLPSMRHLSARISPRRPRLSVVAGQPVDTPPSPALPPQVQIPVATTEAGAEAAETLRARGQFLARQEDWEQLAVEITRAEQTRALTPGLHSQAALMSEGARRDISEAIRDAVARGEPRMVQAAIASLEPLLNDYPGCPVIAQIVAMAHVDAARAWREADAADRHEAYARHMAAAARLNDRFDPFEHDMPLWAAVRCAVLEADPHPQARVADDFEDLIDLDPGNPHHLLVFGCALRPTRFGSWEMLDTQARRVAARTADVWGCGGYAWVYFGALGTDAGAFGRLDAELFAEGLHDILTRHPSQDMANRLAALTGHTLGGPTEAGSARRRVADCLGWIAQDHLREIHPLIWAGVPARNHVDLLDRRDADPQRVGRARALSALGEFYAPLLDGGRRLVFGPEGMRMQGNS